MKTRVAALIMASTILWGPMVLAGPPTLELLPSTGPDPSGAVIARGISGDGQVVVGSQVPLMWERPFCWRKVGGVWMLIALPGEGGPGWGRPVAASFNGDVTGGMTNQYLSGAVGSGTPAVWSGVLSGAPAVGSPLDDSGTAEIRRGTFGGVSSDGAVATGYAHLISPSGSPGEIWAYAGGSAARLSPFPSTTNFSSAVIAGNALSGDGAVVVGSLNDGAGPRPFRWTAAGGFERLPAPTSGSARNARAECISRDGQVIGGHVTPDTLVYNGLGQPCVWRDGYRIDLQNVPGYTSGRVLSLSGDGSIAVGLGYNSLLPLDIGTLNGSKAVFWFHGKATALETYLEDRGIDLGGLRLHLVSGVSDDGKTIVGYGSRATPAVEYLSFIATLATTCLGDLNEDEQMNFADYLEFLAAYDASDRRVDFNGDNRVDFLDYLWFLNLYEQGC